VPGAGDDYASQNPMPTGGGGDDKEPKRGNPIGVPSFQIDPITGQAKVGDNGQPLPWQTVGTVTQVGPRRPGTTDIPAPYQTQAQIGARYFDGDEWALVGGLDPVYRQQVQQEMMDRGLYSSAKPRIAPGAWDNDSATAFKQVLAYANASGLTWVDALKTMPKMDDAAQAVKYGPTAPHVFTPFTATLTNPTDLKAVIRAGARSVLGRTLDDSEVSAFIGNYQSAEMANAQAQYAVQHQNEAARYSAQDAYARAQDEFQQTGQATTQVPTTVETKGGVFTNPASPSNAAEEFARKRNPGEAGAHDIARTFGDFVSLIQNGLAGAQTAGTAGGQ
jgi:hypothetical protein